MTQDTPGHSLALIAHRGYSAAAPENTLSALEAAVAVSADGIEWDMSTAACGTPVLFHDSTLERTTDGRGRLNEIPWSELSGLDAGSWFGGDFAGERVPSLREACEALVDWRYTGTIVAEIKGWASLDDVDRMVEVISATSLRETTRYIALDWAAVYRVARTSPDAPVAFIVERPERWNDGLERARAVDRAGLAVDYRILLEDPRRVDAAFELGIPVGVWTVDEPSQAARLHELGIRDITTNQVKRLAEWRESLSD
ncbi:MAG: hypothetical protein HKO53_08585 [Gemmatimonadetes bacterium]|nr:hypothetical protein [Gemmatimonadota bacterium]